VIKDENGDELTITHNTTYINKFLKETVPTNQAMFEGSWNRSET